MVRPVSTPIVLQRRPEYRLLRLGAKGHVIVDCPPSLGETTQSTLMVADLCLVPITPSPLDLAAAQQALVKWQSTRELRRGLPDVMLVPNRVDLRTRQGRKIAAALAKLSSQVAPSLGYRMAFVDAASRGLPVTHFAPRSPAAAEVHALAMAVRLRLSEARLSTVEDDQPDRVLRIPDRGWSGGNGDHPPIPDLGVARDENRGLFSRLAFWH